MQTINNTIEMAGKFISTDYNERHKTDFYKNDS